MKKIFMLLVVLILLSCSKNDNKNIQKNNNIDNEKIYSFNVDSIQKECSSQSEIICIINMSIKCTLNPLFEECNKFKQYMPSFIFMKDEGLKRPTFQSYKINKIVPRNDDTIEIFTQSSCNGNWFGLCNGNIIYVMKNIKDKWNIIDIYAIEL